MNDQQRQQAELVAGKRAAQLFPPGTRELRKPVGMGKVGTKAGIVHFDPKQLKASAIVKAANGGRIEDLLTSHSMSPMPESKATLAAQQKQLVDGHRKAQLFPKGHPELKVPKGMGRIKTKNGDVWHFNPKKVKASQIVKASNAGRENDILDLGPFTKEEAVQRAAGGEIPVAVVERDKNGTEVRGSAATDKTAHAQMAVMERAKSPEHTVGIENPEDVIAGRYASGGSVNDLADAPWLPRRDLPDAPWARRPTDGPEAWGDKPADGPEAWGDRPASHNDPGSWGAIPAFDPGKPYTEIKGSSKAPPFDPSKPYTVLDDFDHRDAYLAGKDREHASNWSSLALQVPTGFNETLANTVGAPVDAMTWALNHIPGVKIKDPFLGSDFIKRGMGLIGANPDNAPARTSGERIARGVGAGAAAMVAPEAAVGAMGELRALSPRAIEVLKDAFGASETLPTALGNAAVGATAGGAGSVASEVAPDKYKPIAEVGGNLVGGGLGTLGVAATRGARWLGDGFADYLAPLRESGQERLAAKTLTDRATSQAALRDALDSPPSDLLPGSKPTTFQQSGDMGLGSLEREVATQNPADFMQRRAEQNAARLEGLEAVAPAGSPADLSSALRTQLRDLDEATSQAVSRAQAEAHARIEGLGGQRAAEEYGATMRTALATARTEAKNRERALWRAVDPDNKLALPTSSLKEAASGIEKSITPSAKPISGEERDILDSINGYGPVMPFSHVTDLRSRVSAAMRDELRNAGETPAYARLARLRAGIESTITNAVEHQAAQEASMVARGEMSPDQTMIAALQRKVDLWRQENASRRALDESTGIATGSGSGIVRPGFGGQSQARGRSADFTGDQGLSRDVPLEPNFDQAARERLNAATAATRDRKQTYDTGPVGGVLRSAGTQGQYRTMDSAVPEKIFRRGPSGFQSVEAYRKAAGDAEAVGVLGDYAASSLRQAALKPDGTLDPARFAAWRKSHADAFRALPELAGRFEDAAAASRAIEDVAAIRRDALEHYQRGAFGQLVDAHGPEDVTRIIGGLFGQKDAAKTVQKLVDETRNDPAAQEGLRKAVAEYIQHKILSNTEAGTSGQSLIKAYQFQGFVRDNAAILGRIFTSEQVNSLRAIAADLQRSNRSLTAVKLPGGSNTAQDQAARQLSLLSRLVHHGRDAAAGALLGSAAGPFGAIAGTIGGAVVTAMRDAGMKRVDDLVRDALLHPELARKLLLKGPEVGEKSRQMSLAQYLRRTTTAALFAQKQQTAE